MLAESPSSDCGHTGDQRAPAVLEHPTDPITHHPTGISPRQPQIHGVLVEVQPPHLTPCTCSQVWGAQVSLCMTPRGQRGTVQAGCAISPNTCRAEPCKPTPKQGSPCKPRTILASGHCISLPRPPPLSASQCKHSFNNSPESTYFASEGN